VRARSGLPKRAAQRAIREAIEIALDVKQLTYEVNTLLNAASLMNRTVRT
jgi:hypothetical protein